MGAYCPVTDIETKAAAVIKDIFNKFLRGISEEGIDYRGVIYIGLMLTPKGPNVVEFNCRLGDPETQVLLPIIDCDLAEIALACAEGKLSTGLLPIKKGACACVVLAAHGYPDTPVKGKKISGLEKFTQHGDIAVFHAGTNKIADGWITAGGRVLAVSALGADLESAVAAAYKAAAGISFDGMQYRRDIASQGKTS
jgi:phosphoribosylamine--glycine ligase